MQYKHKITHTNEFAAGTGLQGYLPATYEELTRIFGQPNTPATIDGKVKHQWTVRIDGILCTIYDYNEDLNNGRESDWHIGGAAKACLQLVTETYNQQAQR